MTWLEFLERAITVPFKDRGRDYGGWDCWGLVICGYRDVLGIELPDYLDWYKTTKNHRALARAFIDRSGSAGWKNIDPRPGAVVVMMTGRLPTHAGVLVDHNMVLHCEDKTGTVWQRPSELKIEGYYERRRAA